MVTIIGMVGLPAVGKSVFAERLVKEFGFSHVNKDKMRNFFRDSIKYFNDADYSHHNSLIDSVNRVVIPSADILIKELIDQDQNVIIDGYGKFKDRRDRHRENLKKYNTTLIIVYVKEKEEVIIERLKKRESGENWVKHFYKKWKPGFDIPTKDECEFIIEVSPEGYEEAIEKIRKILKKIL